MELEKEVRYSISKKEKDLIIKKTKPLKGRSKMLDITLGFDGFNSYDKYKFICRVRQKGDNKTLEVKNYSNENECVEQAIKLNDVKDGINYLKLIGMKPYLYLDRYRETRTYKDLKIMIDEFDIIGDYVEIEYQDSSKEILYEFMNLINIKDDPQDMYGGIIKEKLKTDKEFKKVFEKKLDEIIND